MSDHVPTPHAEGVRCSCGEDFSPLHHNERGRLVPSMAAAWRRFHRHYADLHPDRRTLPEAPPAEEVALFDSTPYEA